VTAAGTGADGPEAAASVRPVTATAFLESFAAEVGAPLPGPEEIDALLEVAAIAAHGSERLAAPLACWIAGVSGRPASEALAAARRIAPGVD
jgi:hypothetical protein